MNYRAGVKKQSSLRAGEQPSFSTLIPGWEYSVFSADSNEEDVDEGNQEMSDAIGADVHKNSQDRKGSKSGSTAVAPPEPRKKPKPRGNSVKDAHKYRELLLSDIIASAAEKHEEVGKFRKDVLKNKLLAWDDIDSWIQRQMKSEKSAATNATFSIRIESREDLIFCDGRVTLNPEVLKRQELTFTGVEKLFLDYIVPPHDSRNPGTKDRSKTVFISGYGKLNRLREVASKLAKQHQWDEAQAVVFILTGHVPIKKLIRVTSHEKSGPSYQSRMTIEVEPGTSVELVSEAYQKSRKNLLERRGERIRPQSLKHLYLAGFAYRQGKNPADFDEGTLRAWNKKHRDEKSHYEKLALFKRDCKVALDRLLGPDNPWGQDGD
jgi:hypothetical protein